MRRTICGHRGIEWSGAKRSVFVFSCWYAGAERRPTFFLMYRRAPYLLSLLEARIGMQAFDRFLERYMTEEVRTTPELLEQLEAVAGGEAAAWFREQLVSRPSDAG